MHTEPRRSNFVTVVAWIFIVGAGFGAIIGLVQNLMIHFLFPMEELQSQMSAPGAEEMPAIAKFMFSHIDLFFIVIWLIMILVLVAAVGLLHRRNWARIFFVGLMVLGVIWNVGSIFLQLEFMQFGPDVSNAPEEYTAQMERMTTFFTAFAVIFGLGFAALSGWIAWKLCSPPIVAEFRSPVRQYES